MSPNPNAVQLLQTKYAIYTRLIQERADLDTRIMIVATDISQVTSAAFVNAPIGGIEDTPDVGEEVPAPAPKKKAAKKAAPKKAEAAPIVDEGEDQAATTILEVTPSVDEAQVLAGQVITKHGVGKMQELKISERGPYDSQSDDMKRETIQILTDALAQEVAKNG